MINTHVTPLAPYSFSHVEAAAAEILASDGFIKDNERDKDHALGNEATVSEMQGCRKFCEKVSKIVSQHPHALSPNILRSQRAVNEKLYRTFEWKRFAHVFSLSGKVKLPDGSILDFEGFNDIFSIPMHGAMETDS